MISVPDLAQALRAMHTQAFWRSDDEWEAVTGWGCAECGRQGEEEEAWKCPTLHLLDRLVPEEEAAA